MKRYDEIVRLVTHRHGIQTNISGWTIGEYKSLFDTLTQGEYDVCVRCRNCGNIHKINVDCQVCDLSVKLRPEIMKLKINVTERNKIN